MQGDGGSDASGITGRYSDVNTVTIAADWRMVPGATANAPTTSRPISTSRTGFIEDWISLARFVQDLVRAVSLDDTASLDTIATIIQQHDDPKLNPTP